METTRILGLVLVSGVVGFGAYCIGCAFHVWGSRNARSGAGRGVSGWQRRQRWIGAGLIAAGALAALVGLIVQLFLNREGVLRGEGLYTVRVPADLLVDQVAAAASRVGKDGVLARFQTPERKAKIEVARLEQQRLAAQKRSLQAEPLPVDAEIVRRLQEASTEQRHLQTSMHDLEMERSRVIREGQREELSRRDEIREIEEKIDSLRVEVQQTESRSHFIAQRRARATSLNNQKVMSNEEFEDIAKDAALSAEEIARQQGRLKDLGTEKVDLERGLAEFLELAKRQGKEFAEEIAQLRERSAAATRQTDVCQRELDEDLLRAQRHRQWRLAQLDVELNQTIAQGSAMSEGLKICAPFAGRVVYRNPSPQTARSGEELLVLGREGTIRARLRLPAWEAVALQGREVSLQLIEQKTDLGEIRHRFIERRFAGQLLHAVALPHDPGYTLVEFSCEPPEEAVRVMASGEEMAARLISVVPIYYNPLVQLAAVLILGGAAGLATARRGGAPLAQVRGAAPPAALREEANVLIECGAEGVMLDLLGSQLREGIVQGEFEPALVGAAEWSLDRHRARAVRLIARGLGNPMELGEHLERCRRTLLAAPAEVAPANLHEKVEMFRRIVAIMRAVAPASLQPRLGRLLHGLDDLARQAELDDIGWQGNGSVTGAAYDEEKHGVSCPR